MLDPACGEEVVPSGKPPQEELSAIVGDDQAIAFFKAIDPETLKCTTFIANRLIEVAQQLGQTNQCSHFKQNRIKIKEPSCMRLLSNISQN